MRFSARSKVGILISLVTILTLTSAFMVTSFMGRGSATQAAHLTHSVTYHGQRGSANKQKVHVVQHAVNKHSAGKLRALPGHFGKANSARLNAAKSNAPRLSAADNAAVLDPRVSEGGILHNFRGLTAEQSFNLNPFFFEVHPPDQALCAGHDASIAGNPKVVFEMINLAIVETDTSGNRVTSDLLPSTTPPFVGAAGLNAVFGEPGVPLFGRARLHHPHTLYA